MSTKPFLHHSPPLARPPQKPTSPPPSPSRCPLKPNSSPTSAKSPPTDANPPASPPRPTTSLPHVIQNSAKEEEENAEAEIDMDTFNQILDLDEEGSHDFSREMTWAYFSQAEDTFEKLDDALKAKDLVRLSALGHFLKGSSAALGVSKVQASCEKIQNYGELRGEDAGKNLSEKDALDKIERLLGQVKKEYSASEKWLKNWYDGHPDGA